MREGGRFREAAVLLRSLENDYPAVLRRVFSKYGIPFFIDQRRSVAHHPLAETPDGQQAPVQPPPVQRTPIAKTEVPGSNFEVITAMVTIQPGFKAGRHNHPGVVHVQVLEGEFMIQLDGEAEKVFKAGQSLEVPNQAIHNEGAAGSVAAKLIAVYVVEKGKPLLTEVRDSR